MQTVTSPGYDVIGACGACNKVLTPKPYDPLPCKSPYEQLIEAKRQAEEIRKAKEEAKYCCSKKEGIYTSNKTRDASEMTITSSMKAAAAFVGSGTLNAPTFSSTILRAGGNAIGCCTETAFPVASDCCTEKPRQFS
jgi:hypothetical protein